MLYSELLDDLLWLIRKGVKTYKRKYDKTHNPIFNSGILYPEDRVFVWNREESRIVST